MELKNKKILFLGDSITAGGSASDYSKCYLNVIGDMTGAECIGFGVPGTRIARQKKPSPYAHWDESFIDRVDKMDHSADMVIVFGGTNDYGHGDASIGDMNDRTPDTFYGALHCLCTKLINKYPTSRIVFLTPLHRLNEDNLRGEGFKETESLPLKGYVDIILEVAEFYSLPCLNLYATAGIQPNIPILREAYNPDGLHPNDAGHQLLAERIISFLNIL